MAELIITEKPKTAARIADALAEKKPLKQSYKGIPYYTFKRDGKEIIVGCGVGHLYGLAEKKKGKWTYPVFDIEWKPVAETTKGSSFTKKYLDTLKKLAKEATSFTIATDYDIEGEVIGLNIVRFACNQKDASRMKFSALTKADLVEAYKNKSEHLDWGQANAGETRHELDWYYGINLSRALTSAIKSAGMFKILSSGRVQGPSLKIIVEREKEIRAFKPIPFWQLELQAEVKNGDLTCLHEKDKFWERHEAEQIFQKVQRKDGTVSKVDRSRFEQSPPAPFDLTTLQTESYRCFSINPKDTLAIAQELYTSGYISYPRTSSQKLPNLNFSQILTALGKQAAYKELCKTLLKRELKPTEGKKTDPAHPAIYPTGIVPKVSEGRNKKVYDLIVRRFLACFAEPAIRETASVRIEVEGEGFVTSGTTTIEQGWHVYYGTYARFKEEELPLVEKGEHAKNKKTTLQDKETQPPKRYTQASLVRELEKRNLGTKATRSEIVDTLFQRGYVQGIAVEATDLGIHMVDTLAKHCPRIQDEKLTRHFEKELERIRENKKQGKDVLAEAKDILINILAEFKGNEKQIGEGLLSASKEMQEKASVMGKCPNCAGGTLVMKKGRFGKFIACSSYPECKTTFSMPSNGLVKPTDKLCPSCQHPIILMIRKAKKPQEVCININCPLKKIEETVEEKQCPKCQGKLVLRKSIYGSFLGCSTYPKCRHIERLSNGKPQ